MADAGLFVGWGAPVRGREQRGLEVFGEALEYYGRLQQEGRMESFEPVLLEPHGGELAGFVLLRGSAEQVDALRHEEEFERLTARAGLIVERLGVVEAYVGDGVQRQVERYQQAVGEIA